jgi:hypothetical protein
MMMERQKGETMDRTYKVIELVGISEKSSDDAIKNAIAAAGKTLKELSWFEVVEQRGHIVNNKVAEFQVTLKVAFKVLQSK